MIPYSWHLAFQRRLLAVTEWWYHKRHPHEITETQEYES